MKNKIAVVISDIHFNIHTLQIASTVLQHAIDTANDLKIPLIIAGDLHDTKAIIRGEVVNTLLSLLKTVNQAYVLVGNHDLLNEKNKEHGLNYLKLLSNITVIDSACTIKDFNFIPYQTTTEDFLKTLHMMPVNKLVIAHQGFQGAFMGEYIQDKSNVPIEAVKTYKIISGHYHRHQTIGTVTYIGTPYTTTFAEANDGPKGFLILNSDGTFVQKTTNVRKHVIIETNTDIFIESAPYVNPDDLLWVKITGPESKLKKIDKIKIGKTLLGHSNFKLDLIPITATPIIKKSFLNASPSVIFETLIANSTETSVQKSYLKELFYEVINS